MLVPTAQPADEEPVPTPAQRDQFRKALRRAREEAGLSMNALGRDLGVSQSAVWQWEDGKAAPRPEMLAKLEQRLDVTAGSFARLLGYLPTAEPGRPVSSVAEAVRADPRLGDRERELLLGMYRQLVKQRAAGTKPG
jgi:transcriptional regulator with XRE-family HTH domain